MSEFKTGELIDVTMRSLRIDSIDDVGIAQCSLPGHNWRTTINLRVADIEIERVAPEEWPPRHGDLWRDTNGALWAGMQITTADDDIADESYVVLVPLVASMRARGTHPESVLQGYGPVALIHRQPSTEGGAG